MDANFKERHIEKRRLMSYFNMTHDEVLRELAPNFDDRYIDLTTTHDQTDCVLCGQTISCVDKMLIPLLERINSLNDEIVTESSCQCDFFGWVSISFSYRGFYLFVKKIDSIYCQKYPWKHPILGFYSNFIQPPVNNKLFRLSIEHFSKEHTLSMSVRWTFQSTMLEQLCREFDELVK